MGLSKRPGRRRAEEREQALAVQTERQWGEGEGEAELALLEKHRAEHRREVQEYRRALFARPRRSYSREEQENLCRRLIGESDSSRMVQVGPLTRASCCRHPAHLLLPHDIKAQQSMRVHAGPWSHFER